MTHCLSLPNNQILPSNLILPHPDRQLSFLREFDTTLKWSYKYPKRQLHIECYTTFMKCFYHFTNLVIFTAFFLSGCTKTSEIPSDVRQLSKAINKGDVEQVRKTITHGTDVNAKMSEGWTALTSAANHGHLEIVQILIRSGANINGRKDSPLNGDGRTPLMIAAERGHTDIVKFLLENGADTELKDRGGKTAAMFAARAGRKEVLDVLNSRKVFNNSPQGSSS